MADPQPQRAEPQVVDDPPPQTQSFAEPRAHHPPFVQQRKPAGPQLWAVVFTLGGLYYLWTRIFGKSLPSFARSGNRVGAKGHSGSSSSRQAEIQAARERQQQRLQTSSRAHEMVKQAKNGSISSNVRERNVVSSGNNSVQTIQERQRLLKQHQAEKQKQREMEDKKKKQRQLYLKQKALEEKEEEKRKKDQELGPGWEYREDPSAAINSMDPQSGSGGGGYKPQKTCTRRGG